MGIRSIVRQLIVRQRDSPAVLNVICVRNEYDWVVFLNFSKINGGNIDIHTVRNGSNNFGLFNFHFFSQKYRAIELSDYIESSDYRYAPAIRYAIYHEFISLIVQLCVARFQQEHARYYVDTILPVILNRISLNALSPYRTINSVGVLNIF